MIINRVVLLMFGVTLMCHGVKDDCSSTYLKFFPWNCAIVKKAKVKADLINGCVDALQDQGGNWFNYVHCYYLREDMAKFLSYEPRYLVLPGEDICKALQQLKDDPFCAKNQDLCRQFLAVGNVLGVWFRCVSAQYASPHEYEQFFADHGVLPVKR